ncbi:uncharacterized protein METZ01_LOCUS138011 [marine metagenome]|jgi:hypothetical protein|uniref:Uncharacterized protein n=1 Tax=marine metagenome TaxID=408172 RepID=A0A381Z8S6_9ZZZZ
MTFHTNPLQNRLDLLAKLLKISLWDFGTQTSGRYT